MTESFGEVLRDKRRSQGLTLRDTATRLGISVPYLSDVENGRRNPFSGELLKRAAKVLEIDESVLVSSSAESMGEVKIILPTGSEAESKRSLIKRFAGRIGLLATDRVRDLDLVLMEHGAVIPTGERNTALDRFRREVDGVQVDAERLLQLAEILRGHAVVVSLPSDGVGRELLQRFSTLKTALPSHLVDEMNRLLDKAAP